MIDFTHEDIERLWNSISHYIPERQKLDCAIAEMDMEKRKINTTFEKYFVIEPFILLEN